MKQAQKKISFSRGSLRDTRSARTVLLRMAADQDRAERIRSLKQARPDLTWRRIADFVGVTERAAADWQKKGGIDYANAEKLAEILEVDVDYIWRGPQNNGTPDLFPDATIEDRLDRMERRLMNLLEQQNELLARQSEILEKIEAAMDEESVAGRVDAAIAQVVRERGGTALESVPRPPARARAKTAK